MVSSASAIACCRAGHGISLSIARYAHKQNPFPRRTRLSLPRVPPRIIQRGNNRQACFFADEDDHFFLHWLARHADQTGCRVHACVLMNNHVHLFISTERADVPGALMKGLGQSYVQYVNCIYRRSGTLWEGRFRACRTQEQDTLPPTNVSSN